MFKRLVHDWKDKCSPRETAEKVKRFHHYYAINRHKMTTLSMYKRFFYFTFGLLNHPAPALHSNDYSPDDNRYACI
jgi:NAD+ synthase (glutamine-hydrolysing)